MSSHTFCYLEKWVLWIACKKPCTLTCMVDFDLCKIVVTFISYELIIIIDPVLIFYIRSLIVMKNEICTFPICIIEVCILKNKRSDCSKTPLKDRIRSCTYFRCILLVQSNSSVMKFSKISILKGLKKSLSLCAARAN